MRTAAAMSAALQQAFMTREEYQEVREEDRAWRHLRRPLALLAGFLIFLVILAASSVSLSIVFPGKAQPFCSKHPIPPSGILDDSMHSYYFTEYEATQYFWLVVFVPTAVLFVVSAAYLFAGGGY
jgi:translation initiation factor 3 subunit L